MKPLIGCRKFLKQFVSASESVGAMYSLSQATLRAKAVEIKEGVKLAIATICVDRLGDHRYEPTFRFFPELGLNSGESNLWPPGTLTPSSIDGIKERIPHRAPMLLIDRVRQIVVGKSAIGVKAVSNGEPFFAGHFPDYPMTKLAIEAGHITEEELDDWPTMMRRTTENWKFIPRWKKREKTRTNQLQRLNNIIWMMCWNHASDKIVKFAVFRKGPLSRIVFHYLNLKSVLLWSIWGEGGLLHKASFRFRPLTYSIAAIKLILKGDFNQLADKIKNKAIKPFKRYANSRNLGS